MIKNLAYRLLEGFCNVSTKILRNFPQERGVDIKYVILAIVLYTPAILNKCSEKNNEAHQQNPTEIFTNDTTNSYDINKNYKYVIYPDSIDKLINETLIDTEKHNIPLRFNLKENTFKPYSPIIMDEYTIFKIPKNTLQRNNH